MKKFFTLAIAACFGLAANAQDPSQWKVGQEVTEEISWKAYDAKDEDPANPVWQGFAYGTKGEWEFRPAGVEQITALQTEDANNNNYFMCWGVYNLPPLDVYQEFTMPKGVYTVSVSGCYRHGQDDVTLRMWASGEKTENCFVYATVDGDTYQTPMQYKYQADITEPLGASFDNNNWGNEKAYDWNGTKIWSPQSHCAADFYLENDKFKGNDVLFVVPEDGMTVRVGISKPVEVAQDQIWWNHWKMFYEGEYNDEAKAMVAAKKFYTLKENAENYVFTVQDTYAALGALMYDVIGEIEIEDEKSLESINLAIAQITAADALNHTVFAKATAMEKNLDICQGICAVTDYAGKAEFQVSIELASALLYSEELEEETTLETFIEAADALAKARIDYLLTQEKGADGSYDFTHALAFPYWVNQENTGYHDADGYHYPQNVVDALNVVDDGGSSNLETGEGTKSDAPCTFEAVSSKATWSNKANAENTWIYVDNWNGWHGGMKACIQKLKGYAGINSDWSTGAGSGPGGMEVFQNLSNLPDGFYTLEGSVWHNTNEDGSPNWSGDINYMFFEDGEGNTLAKEYQVNESPGYWSGWACDQYTVLKTDFVELKGGYARVGYFNKCWFLNSIMELKYYGAEIDYTGIIQKKIEEAQPAEGELWPGDLKAYNEKVAKVVFPIAGKAAYDEAVAIVNEAIAFKNMAKGITSSFNVPNKYLELTEKYAEGIQTEILDVAWAATMNLGEGENDTYKDAQTANEVYNEYVNYLAAYDDATLNYYTDEMKSVLAPQEADLKANYANVATLQKYMSEIATAKNNAIFDELCKDASETNPVEITAQYVKNASFAEGPKTGWTCEGADVNPSVNTYGRELAECWNQQPFSISQTLYAMPAGTYELRVRACYRDGGTADQGMVDRFNNGTFAYNAKAFLNGYESDVKSVCDAGWEDPSFSTWYNGKNSADALKAIGFVADWDNTIYVNEGEYAKVAAMWENDPDHQDDLFALTEGKSDIDMASPAYPFDTKTADKFYPSSMAGFQERCAKSPEAYCNKVQAYLPEAGVLKLGLKKVEALSGDWLIYDDFQLFYLGKNPSTGITDVNNDAATQTIFNLAGQPLKSVQKGINIINGKKVLVK